MKRLALVFALATLASCSGGGKATSDSSTETAQGTAKLWLAAAIASDDARLQELSTSDFRDRAPGYATQVREKFDTMEGVRWSGSGQEGQEYSWSAMGPGGGVLFFKVRALGPTDYKVSDISTSW